MERKAGQERGDRGRRGRRGGSDDREGKGGRKRLTIGGEREEEREMIGEEWSNDREKRRRKRYDDEGEKGDGEESGRAQST